MPDSNPMQCRYCNTLFDRAAGPCWHCDAGLGNAELERITLVSGEHTLRYCPHCRYDLVGNPGVPSCPECGYAMPESWTQFRRAQNRHAATLRAGVTFGMLSKAAGISLIVLTVCLLLDGGDLIFDIGWGRTMPQQFVAYLTAAAMIASAVLVPAWAATLLITLGRGRHERLADASNVATNAPRLALSRSRVFRWAGRIAAGMLIVLAILGQMF
ncbi:hypothetical protein OT109_03185 [Phycisphaeraceae bacterium D3-23]